MRPSRLLLLLLLLVPLAAAPPAGAAPRKLPYGCVMLDAPLADWEALRDLIDPADLVGERFLRTEKWPHVTVLYGLHDDATAEVVALLSAVARRPRFRVVDLSIFTNPGCDVVKFGVTSRELVELNRRLKKFAHTDPHDAFRPHLTLAFVRKGTGGRYAQKIRPPAEYRGARFVYTTRHGERFEIPIPGFDPEAKLKPVSGKPLSRRLKRPAPPRPAPEKGTAAPEGGRN